LSADDLLRRVNNDSLIPAGTLHCAEVVTEVLEPSLGLRTTACDKQLVVFWVGNDASPIKWSSDPAL
jgi:hypothetical protein